MRVLHFVRQAAMVVLLAMAFDIATASAQINANYQSSGPAPNANLFFDSQVSNSDLVNNGQSTLSSITFSRGPTFGGISGTNSGVNNGSASQSTSTTTFWTNSQVPAMVTFNLNTSANTNGYDITSIQTIAGWTGVNITQANQKYELQVRQVGLPTFKSLGTFTNAPFSAASNDGSSTMTTLTDTLGKLGTNIDAVRFNLVYPGLVGNGSTLGTVYREIDVFGAPTTTAAPVVNLIQNGSFELPAIGAGSSAVTGNAIPNWNITGTATLVNGQFGTIASDGSRWLSLENTGAAPGNVATISQTFATTPGWTYELAFNYSALGAASVTSPWELEYSVGDVTNILEIPNGPTTVLYPWLSESVQFTATSNFTTLSFTGMSQIAGFYGAAIDGVSVVLVATPEPAALWMWGCTGLLAVVGVVCVRKSAKNRK